MYLQVKSTRMNQISPTCLSAVAVDLPLVAILDVENQENRCHHNSENRAARENSINRQVHLTSLDDAQRLVLRWTATNPTPWSAIFEQQTIL